MGLWESASWALAFWWLVPVDCSRFLVGGFGGLLSLSGGWFRWTSQAGSCLDTSSGFLAGELVGMLAHAGCKQ